MFVSTSASSSSIFFAGLSSSALDEVFATGAAGIVAAGEGFAELDVAAAELLSAAKAATEKKILNSRLALRAFL
jgi:L-asparaginase/Glu-tRNA(Gln) amidotransferase subunit D